MRILRNQNSIHKGVGVLLTDEEAISLLAELQKVTQPLPDGRPSWITSLAEKLEAELIL